MLGRILIFKTSLTAGLAAFTPQKWAEPHARAFPPWKASCSVPTCALLLCVVMGYTQRLIIGQERRPFPRRESSGVRTEQAETRSRRARVGEWRPPEPDWCGQHRGADRRAPTLDGEGKSNVWSRSTATAPAGAETRKITCHKFFASFAVIFKVDTKRSDNNLP